MSETANLIREAAHRLFAQHVTNDLLHRAENGEWPRRCGMRSKRRAFSTRSPIARRRLRERAANTAVLLRAAARHLAPIPLGETIVVRALLSARKVKAPRGPLSFAVLDGHTHTHGDHAHLEGSARRALRSGAMRPMFCSRAKDGKEAVLIATRRGKLAKDVNIAGEAARQPGVRRHGRDRRSRTSTGDDLLCAGAALRAMRDCRRA